jgi:hypothetical protein
MCAAGLPSAPGYAPVWQLAHWLATETCVWLNVLGVNAVVLWHAMQFVAPTGIWVAGFPVAVAPLWHVTQLVAAVNVLWSKRATGDHAMVRWHVSHDAVVTTCPAGLPGACMPLWHVAQVPAATPAWFIFAPLKATVEWHVSHACCVATWASGLTVLPRDQRDPATWHESQLRGVPLNTPPTWHPSHGAALCTPVSG